MNELIVGLPEFSKAARGATIMVSDRVENGEAIFQVQDDGAGFDMQYAEGLCGVFHRLHRSEDFAGTGVRLAVAHRIVTRHSGRIWAHGIPDVGACFQFALPINHH